MRRWQWGAALALAALAGCRRSGPPFSPEQALKTFQIESGFRVETFASEPDIASPVDMEFDEDGRVWVVENPGYPLNVEGRVGKVKLLEDTNGDGRPDRSTLFADRLVMPTGVLRWKKGVLVTDAPHVWYMEDTDGDRKADVRRIVLTGFAFTNPQHTVNNPVYGLDNWIYLAHEGPTTAVIFPDKFGDRGSEIHFADRPDGPRLTIERRNVRFRPDSFELEYLSGATQFGYATDEWGRHFTHNNSNHLRHEVIAARYLKRNPDLLAASATQNISDHGANAPVFPVTHRPQYQMLTNAGEFTSACGLTVYLGGAFPWAEKTSLIAEPTHNLVHRDVWSQAGATFSARRDREGVEFLASTDAWFRPVNFEVGPDGALYMVDYYRPIIEHPEWTSEHVHHSPNLYQGSDRGRIYRMVPVASAPPLPRGVRLGTASEEDLVKQLESPNLWRRRTAQRLLVDRGGERAVEPLVRLFRTTRSPLGRLHALWTLDGLGKLEPALIEAALGDAEAGVRENAVILAEARLAAAPGLVTRLLPMAEDPDPRVRFQVLCTLGYVNSQPARAARDRLLRRDIEDGWVQLAALSSSSADAPAFFETALQLGKTKTEGRAQLFRYVAAMIGNRGKASEIRRLLGAVAGSSAWWRAAALDGLGQRLRAKAAPPDAPTALLRLFADRDVAVRKAALRLLERTGFPSGAGATAALKRAAGTAADGNEDADLRADSIALLALSEPAANEALFKKLIDPQSPEPVQAAAVRAFGRVKGDATGAFLLEKWRTLTAPARSEAADAMFLAPGRARLLVEAIRNGDVQPWTLNFFQKRNLIMNRDESIRAVARPLLEEKAGEREKILQSYETALSKTGDAARGRQVFERVCAKCHKFQGLGTEVGPDLGTVKNRSPQMLLPDILVPNRSISQHYETYVVERASGGSVEGVLASQTPSAIALRREEGKEDVIPRADIKRMYVTNLSAMPEDLDKQVDLQQMADLLEFLRRGK